MHFWGLLLNLHVRIRTVFVRIRTSVTNIIADNKAPMHNPLTD